MGENPYLGHDPDADPERLRALCRAQKRFLRDITRLELEKTKLEARLVRAYAGLSDATIAVGELTHPDRLGRGIALAEKSVRAELARRLRVSDRTVSARTGHAVTVREFPILMRAYSAGRVTTGHVWVITRAAEPVDTPERRDVYEAHVVDYALGHSVSRTKRYAQRIAERLAEKPLEDRANAAMRERRVWVEPQEDGMAQLCVLTSAPVAQAMKSRIQEFADAVHDHHRAEGDATHHDGRTRANLAADIATELLLTGSPSSVSTGGVPAGLLSGVAPEIQLVVPALTLLPKEVRDRLRELPELRQLAGIGMQPEMPGYGPISDEIARLFALDAPGWNETVIHPERGRVLTVDRYTPSSAQKRFIHARDQHCRFPGCVAPIARTEIDHTIEWANGGPTATNNLSLLCVLHHTLKHHQIHDQYRWEVAQNDHGVLTWTSPYGTKQQDEAPTDLMFLPVPSLATRVRTGDRSAEPDDDIPAPF